jgi:predicted ArsR family transcriptional regulator
MRQGPGISRRALLDELKRRGARTAAALATELQITPTAARLHLDELAAEGLVEVAAHREGGAGRPARRWALTERARSLFPDHHGELTVQLLDALRATIGDDGIERVLAARDGEQRAAYERALPAKGVGARVRALAELRTDEGYMAEAVEQPDGSWLLVEHNCPICEAAATCQGLCRSELDTFRTVLGDQVAVEREEHLLSGGERCVYRVTPVSVGRRRRAPAPAPAT